MGVAKLLDNADLFTHILFVDADMGFSPFRFERMLQYDEPFVGCPGPVKFIHWGNVPEAILRGLDPQTFALRYALNFIKLGEIEAVNGFAKIKDMGCCFCLVKTEVLTAMKEKYPDLLCNNMSHVNGEDLESTNTYTFFDTHTDADGRYLECDHAFMARWREMGGDVWADLTGDLVHVGTYHFQGDMSQFFFGESGKSGHVSAITTKWGPHLPIEEPVSD